MHFLRTLAVVALVVGCPTAYAQSGPSDTLSADTDRPLIVGSGHGSLFASDGSIIKPNRDVIAQSIRQYLAQARRNSDREVLEMSRSIEDEVRKFTDAVDLDDIIRDSIVLDWLLEQRKDAESDRLSGIVTAMRKSYLQDVLRIDREGLRLHYNTGLPEKFLREFTDIGVAKYALTDVDSEEYVRLC